LELGTQAFHYTHNNITSVKYVYVTINILFCLREMGGEMGGGRGRERDTKRKGERERSCFRGQSLNSTSELL
jgi:hypothetical protein